MAKRIPLIVSRFINLLWVNLPGNFDLKYIIREKILFMTIIVEDEKTGNIRKLKKQYSISKIEKRKDDLFGMAGDCASEIKSFIRRRKK